MLAKRGNYQSTNSVILAEPVSTSIGTAVLDLVERLIEIVKKLLALLQVRVAVGMVIGVFLRRRWRVGLQADNAGYSAHDCIWSK